jgi:hypothetical protein
MSRPHHIVQPQQPSSKGWIACEAHKARRFAVLKLHSYRSRGRDITVTKTVLSCTTRAEAEQAASHLNAGGLPAKRKLPTVGERFPHQQGVGIIARGIGRDVLP